MIIDNSVLVVLTIGGIIFIFAIREWRAYIVQKMKISSTIQPQKANGKSLFDFVDYALQEINKVAAEMSELGVKKEQLVPLEKRYNQLKWLKDNQGLAVPIIEGGQKMIENFLGGIFK